MGPHVRHRHLVVAAAALLLALGAPAAADAARPSLPNSWGSTHFVVHYTQSSTTPLSTAQSVAAYAEEGYSHLVTGGGDPHNAGLRVPINDGDGKTDIYLTTWSGDPSYSGGITIRDTTPPYANWFILTPDLTLEGMRFRAVHEFMHVIQAAYQPDPGAPIGGMWTESTANWAVSWSLPVDMTPGDSNFYDVATAPAPWLPLDCSYGTWPTVGGRPCGNGYWQWLFMERQVEDYGVDFIGGLLERVKACVTDCTTDTSDRTFLNAEISAQSSGIATLSQKYGRYAWQVWDPTAWSTGGLAQLHADVGRPPAARWDRSLLTTSESGAAYTIDHLATRYVLLENFGDPAASGPNDVLHYRVTRPASGQLGSWVYLTRAKGSTSWAFHNVTAATGDIVIDPAATREVMFPLTNTSYADAQAFSYGVSVTRGTPTPPANDTQAGAAAATLDVPVQTDTVYAGGRASTETPGCGGYDLTGVFNGVWYRFTAPNTGSYTFDTTTSTLTPVIVLTDHGTTTFRGCSAFNGKFSTTLNKGDARDIYVGRQASDTSDNTLARLLITGPPSNTVAPVVTGTARDGQTLTRTSDGTWTGSPTSTTRQWRRCDSAGASCVNIPSATGTSYTLTSSDVGKTIRLQVSATNANGTGTGDSAATASVTAAAPVNTVAPAVVGTAKQGQTLAMTNGTWTGTPTITYAHRWERCTGATCTAIPGAVTGTYTASADDVGHPLRAVVTASNAGGSVSAASAMTAAVTALTTPDGGTPPPTPPPTPTTPSLVPVPGTGTTTTPAITPVRTVTLVTRRLTLDRRGRISVTLRCTATDAQPCRATLTLKTARKVRVGSRSRILTLATGSASVRNGAMATVVLKPGRTARRYVRVARRVAAKLTLGARQADGSVRTATTAVTVRAR